MNRCRSVIGISEGDFWPKRWWRCGLTEHHDDDHVAYGGGRPVLRFAVGERRPKGVTLNGEPASWAPTQENVLPLKKDVDAA